MESLSLRAVVQHNIKATRHRDDQLVKRLVRMTAPVSTTRNVVKVVHPLDRKWYVAIAFDERKSLRLYLAVKIVSQCVDCESGQSRNSAPARLPLYLGRRILCDNYRDVRQKILGEIDGNRV